MGQITSITSGVTNLFFSKAAEIRLAKTKIENPIARVVESSFIPATCNNNKNVIIEGTMAANFFFRIKLAIRSEPSTIITPLKIGITVWTNLYATIDSSFAVRTLRF